jgi:SRSO17 transposase
VLSLQLPARAWQPMSAGEGAKGHRIYDWALIDIDDPTQRPDSQSGQRRLLIRRHRRTGERAYYRCWTPVPVPLSTLVQVAGTRWAIEEDFQTSKGLTALDEHQVRTWTSWHRWTAQAMLAHAYLTITAATEHTAGPPPTGQIPLTRNEISHLFAVLALTPAHSPQHRLHWSTWRRRHQHRARTSHYQRQATQQ